MICPENAKPPGPKSGAAFSDHALEFGTQHQRGGAAGRDVHEWRRALVQRIVHDGVEDVVDEQLRGEVLRHLVFGEGIETPVARQLRPLVGGEERAAVDLRAIGRLAADFPLVGDVVFRQHVERLVRDVGKLKSDVVGGVTCDCVTCERISTRPP